MQCTEKPSKDNLRLVKEGEDEEECDDKENIVNNYQRPANSTSTLKGESKGAVEEEQKK